MKTTVKFAILRCLCFLLGIGSTIGFVQWKNKHDIDGFSRTESEMFIEHQLPSNAPECSPDHNAHNRSKECYNELRKHYFKIGVYKLFPCALLMANKYHYTQAYFDVYYSLYDLNSLGENENPPVKNWSLDKLDQKTQKMAVEYLKIAADKGHLKAKKIWGLYRKEGRYMDINY